MVRIDADDFDHAHPLMELVQRDGYKTDWAPAGDCHEDVTCIICTARSDSVFLVSLPVWMEAQEDVVP